MVNLFLSVVFFYNERLRYYNMNFIPVFVPYRCVNGNKIYIFP